ncbi:MAG: transposase [Clostridia bacterium]|nr:transposase [Clostridia bacterium]
MPRKARLKSEQSVYHIICRSVSEYLLFRDENDKDYYLSLLKRYKEKYMCKIYAYCLMDNHLHIHFDPSGFDISKFMHCINVAYVRYYNKKYQRHGPVFQERFESRILDTDEYNLTLSAYIHNNAKDIPDYSGREEEYPYSSYGIYLGVKKDVLGLVDLSFVMALFNTQNKHRFIQRYRDFVSHHRDMGTSAKKCKELSKAIENEYRSGRKIIHRDWHPSKIISYISDKLLVNKTGSIMLKTKKRLIEYRAMCVYAMRVLCGLGFRDICEYVYNITISACSSLCDRGYDLIKDDRKYKEIFDALLDAKLA